ncbi:MAG: hypothetical protein Q4D82_01410 [Neisseria sp.]|nr:hypothetical protein [Neisseria sp.]
MEREAIYSALFDKLKTVPGIQTVSRRLRHWEDVPDYEQPALFLAPVEEELKTDTAQSSRYLMRANVYLYVHSHAEEGAAADLNRCLDALIRVLNTPHPVTGKTDLPVGGVHYCRAEGQIELDEGLFGGQAFAVVPVMILATDAV